MQSYMCLSGAPLSNYTRDRIRQVRARARAPMPPVHLWGPAPDNFPPRPPFRLPPRCLLLSSTMSSPSNPPTGPCGESQCGCLGHETRAIEAGIVVIHKVSAPNQWPRASYSPCTMHADCAHGSDDVRQLRAQILSACHVRPSSTISRTCSSSRRYHRLAQGSTPASAFELVSTARPTAVSPRKPPGPVSAFMLPTAKSNVNAERLSRADQSKRGNYSNPKGPSKSSGSAGPSQSDTGTVTFALFLCPFPVGRSNINLLVSLVNLSVSPMP